LPPFIYFSTSYREFHPMAFRVLIIGGTGQVGAAVVWALLAAPTCAEVVMVKRKAVSLTADHACGR
jgi:nucleoside-diphosphate-sugar epimerase